MHDYCEMVSVAQAILEGYLGLTRLAIDNYFFRRVTMLQQQSLTEGKLEDRTEAIESVTNKIARSDNIEDILTIITQETRRLLQCDRLIVYQFMSDWNGNVVAESVGAGWKSLLIEANSDNSSGDDFQQDRCILRNRLLAKTDIVELDTFLRETKGGKYAF